MEYEDQLLRNSNFKQSNKDSHTNSIEGSKPVSPIQSVRRNQSESDVSWLHQEEQNHQSSESINHENSSGVFVMTHRTIFTISGEDSRPVQVIPTFFQYNDSKEQLAQYEEADNQGDLCENVSQGELPMTNTSLLSCPPQKRNNTEEALPSECILTSNIRPGNSELCNFNESKTSPIDSPSRSESSTPIGSSSCPPTFLDTLSTPYHSSNQSQESKKKVLEAANEASPTVKNMIDLYNKRITEKQGLLINPFKPGDPFTETKATKSQTEEGEKASESTGSYEDSKNKIIKSQSTSILQNRPKAPNLLIQKSSSGTNDFNYSHKTFQPSSAPVKFSGVVPIPLTLAEHSNNFFWGSQADLPLMEESYGVAYENESTRSQTSSEKPRAVKIRKAKEEFLARGATPTSTRKRLSGEYEYHSETSDHSQSVRGVSVPASPSPLNSSSDSKAASEACLSKGTENKQLSVRRKDSLRRQSEGGIYHEEDFRKSVTKSASSGLIELRKKHPRGLPPSNKEKRKSFADDSDTKRSSRGIFKLFKLTKGKERKEQGAVQKLCRQSLAVDIASNNQATSSETSSRVPTAIDKLIPSTSARDNEQPSTSSLPPPGASSIPMSCSRSSRTLPREAQPESSASSSRSCPSSPVALRKSRTAQWLAKGKNIFKSRSPSPSKRPR